MRCPQHFMQIPQLQIYSLIFKTFDSDIDKISAKWGIFGRSFNDIGTAIVGRISDINKGFQATDDLIGAVKDSDSIWKRLYPSKEDIQSKMIDIDALYPKMDDMLAEEKLNVLKQQQQLVDTNKASWSNYFKERKEGEKWQIDFVQNTNLEKASLDDVKNAYNSARDGAIAHNAALKQQTLSAKAGKVALKGLAMAGNMLVGMLIGVAVSAFVGWLDDMAHAAENAKKEAEEFASSFEDMQKTQKENTKTVAELNDEYQKLSQGVNALGDNVSLSTDEYNRYHKITNQVADLIPDLVQGFDAEGNAILKVKGNLADLNEEYQKTKQNEARKIYYSKDEDGDYKVDSVFDNYNNDVEKIQKDLLTPQHLLDFKNIKDFYDRAGIDAVTRYAKKYAGVEIDNSYMSLTEEQFKLIQKNAALEVKILQNELNAKQSEIVETMTNYATTTEDYWKLDDNKKTQFSSFFNNLSTDFINTNLADEDGKVFKTITEKFVNNTIAALSANKNGINDAFNELFELDLETINPEEAKEKIDELLAIICKTLGIDNTGDKGVKQLKLSLGFDTVDADAIKFRTKRKNFYWQEKDVSGHTKQEGIDRNTQVDNWIADKNVTTDELEKLENDGYGTTTSINTLTKALQKYRKEISNQSTSSTDKISSQKSKIEELKKEYQEVTNQLGSDGDTSSLYKNSDKIEKIKTKLAELKSQAFTDAWSTLETTDDDTLKNAKKELTDLADAGKLTVDELKCIDGVEKYFEEIGLSAEEAVKKINDLTDSPKQLSTLKSAIGSIQDAYSEKKENKVVGADTLSKMESEFSSAGKAWDNYKQIAGSAKTSTTDLKKAQDELATAYINSNNFLSGLVDETGKCTDANKQYYISQLEELGIKNAEEVVNNAIIQQKANLAVQSVNLENATESEIASLAAENNTLNATSGALNNYFYYKTLASNSALSTSASVQNLITLGKQCGIAKSEIQDLQRLLSALNQVEYNNKLLDDPNIDDHAKMQIRSQTDSLNGTISYLQGKAGKKAKTNVKTTNTGDDNVNSTKNGSGSGSKSSSSSKQTFDWIEKRLDHLANKTQKTIDKINNYIKQGTKNKYYTALLKNIDDEIKANDTAAKKYSKKANSVTISKNKKKDADLKKKVRTGVIDGNYKDLIKEYGEKTADKIESYRTWYEKSQNAKNTARQKRQEKRDKTREALDSKLEYRGNELSRLQTTADKVQSKIELNEARGLQVTSKQYKNLVKNADAQKANLTEQNSLLKEYQKNIKIGSAEWYDIQSQIDENNASIQELTTSQTEWNAEIRRMPLNVVQSMVDLLDSAKSSFESLLNLKKQLDKYTSSEDIEKQINFEKDNMRYQSSLMKELSAGDLNAALDNEGLNKTQKQQYTSYLEQLAKGDIGQERFFELISKLGISKKDYNRNRNTLLKDSTQSMLEYYSSFLKSANNIDQYAESYIDMQIDKLQEERDLLKEINDTKSKSLELEKKLQKLQEAKQNKTNLIYREGYGFGYESDRDEVNNAQNDLDDYNFELNQEQYDKAIKVLEDIRDKQSYVTLDKDGNVLTPDWNNWLKKIIETLNSKNFTFNIVQGQDGNIVTAPKYAKGTKSAKGGMSVVGENGIEMRFLNQGDAILPHDVTENLWEFGMNPQQMIIDNLKLPDYSKLIQPRSVENNRTIHIDKVELQGVNDVQTLMRDLDHLASTINSDAQQRAWKY